MTDTLIPRVMHALTTGDDDQIRAVFTPDAEWLSPAGNAVATALGAPHHMVGVDAIARFFGTDFPRLFPEGLDPVVTGAHGDGTSATLEATVRGRLPGGRLYDVDYCFVFDVRGDRVHRVREYADTARGHRLIGDLTA
ncbi:nuclear transport factor 2 family protein [Tsukamurella sp. 1534]|uniref:nuclear transport factor 2 family protein n=1 Tax=Tsukamurella sp. 1534 TaxID=1151061 RepID=UPI000309FFD7|nr:nuclear transport factor 2 family protein [Tsukamurella sp. 1534]